MLWLALRLPLLPLEVFPGSPSSSAVIANERIVACDTHAADGGIVPGMRLADAWALLPELTVLARDAAREARQLEALACWAGSFTSEVSLSPPAALLLEVQGSLRLFGGQDALLERVMAGIAGQGHVACAALAPTPHAALCLAGHAGRPGHLPCCRTLSETREALAGLPLPALELPPAQERRMAGFGVRSVGDVLCLPRAGLSRRFGAGFSMMLARMLGDVPDPQPRFCFPESFSASIELPAPVADASRLLFAIQRLVQQLCGWLAVRACGVAVCELLLAHERTPTTRLVPAFTTATRDPERVMRVLRERVERLALAAPVASITLLADRPESLPGRDGGLFGEMAAGEGVMLLVERLQARLGAAAVQALAVRAEHRPELASVDVAPGADCPRVATGPRPAWLLPQPQALPEVGGRPQRNGSLTLLSGPERIESGWWDADEPGAAGDVRRDYFVALAQHREWLWIFRSEDGWFLHGFFA